MELDFAGRRAAAAAVRALGRRVALLVPLLLLKGGPAGASGADEWWLKCVAIPNDHARLACFDGAVPRARIAVVVGRQAATTTTTATALPPFPDRMPSQRAERPRLRFSLGYGLGIASHDGTFIVQHGHLHLLSGFGNAGESFDAQAWMQGWPRRDWAVGLEYFHMQNIGRIGLDLPFGLSVLTDPVDATVMARVKADTVFANIAYEPRSTSPLRTYIGLGLGAGEGSGHFKLFVHNDFIGTTTSISDGSSPFAALQGFVGVDIPVYSAYYIGLQGKAFWVTAHPAGIDQRYLDFNFGVSVGRSF